ncbi:hypothetical protein R1flu_021602 [Riccia fluitans]|uniref:Secondary thiamine-phosphate synthase enzyme n=1 Tax=Riccia fluitans TaxID=41844 RepID=A0ABD1ZPV5_9MARC
MWRTVLLLSAENRVSNLGLLDNIRKVKKHFCRATASVYFEFREKVIPPQPIVSVFSPWWYSFRLAAMEALLTSCTSSSVVLAHAITANSFSRAQNPSFSFLLGGTSLKATWGLEASASSQSLESNLRSSRNAKRWSGFVTRCETGNGTVSAVRPTEWVQKQFELPGFSRGCHIITRGIISAVPEIKEFEIGIAHVFVLHTSCSLTINENASPDVPLDMEDTLNRIVPEGRHYRHLDEGLDDMPAHVKASMMGSSLTIPIRGGRLNLGIWQGIWLNEHRNYGGPRSICVTIQGQKRADGRVYK